MPGGRSLPAVRPLTFQGGRGKVLNPALGPQNRYPSPLVCAYLRRLAIYLLYYLRRHLFAVLGSAIAIAALAAAGRRLAVPLSP